MINLSALKAYLRQKCLVSLQELCQHFALEPEVLRPVLEHHFIQKKLLVRQKLNSKCARKCGPCPEKTQENTELYNWCSKTKP